MRCVLSCYFCYLFELSLLLTFITDIFCDVWEQRCRCRLAALRRYCLGCCLPSDLASCWVVYAKGTWLHARPPSSHFSYRFKQVGILARIRKVTRAGEGFFAEWENGGYTLFGNNVVGFKRGNEAKLLKHSHSERNNDTITSSMMPFLAWTIIRLYLSLSLKRCNRQTLTLMRSLARNSRLPFFGFLPNDGSHASHVLFPLTFRSW